MRKFPPLPGFGTCDRDRCQSCHALASGATAAAAAAMDVARLAFPDGYFDAAVATFLFCTLPEDLQLPALANCGGSSSRAGRYVCWNMCGLAAPFGAPSPNSGSHGSPGYGPAFDRSPPRTGRGSFRIDEFDQAHDGRSNGKISRASKNQSRWQQRRLLPPWPRSTSAEAGQEATPF